MSGIVGTDAVRMDGTGHRQTILDLAVGNRVAARERAARLDDLLAAALQDASQNVEIHLLGETYDIERGAHGAAHGIHVAECVGRGNLTENIRVFHHRREKVQRLHDGEVVGQAIDRRVVARLGADQQIGIGRPRQFFQHSRQRRRPELCRTAAASAKLNLLHRLTPLQNIVPQGLAALACLPFQMRGSVSAGRVPLGSAPHRRRVHRRSGAR